MLGFFRNKKKDIEVSCPVCLREFSFTYKPHEITNYDYKYSKNAGFVYSLQCDFCDAEASIVQFRTGEVTTFDNKWVKLEKEQSDEIELVRSELLSMKARLEKGPDNELELQLKESEARLKNLERIFDIQVQRYRDFQLKWQDKRRNELLNQGSQP